MLDEDVTRCHTELTAAATKATRSIQSFQIFSSDLKDKNWSKSNIEALASQAKYWRHWMINDRLDSFRARYVNQVDEPKLGDFVLLRGHPVLCGMMLFEVNVITQASGIILADAWSTLPSVLYLYQACQLEGLLIKPA